MDSRHQKSNSVLQGEGFFFDKIISRKSSVGCSSRIYYYRSAEGVPFDWEMQPGTPKNPPEEAEVSNIPPPSPPPAVWSLGVQKPRVLDRPNKPSKKTMLSRLRFWKKTKKEQQFQGLDKFGNFEVCSSDGEFVSASPRNSTSSSSASCINGPAVQPPSRLGCCSPGRDRVDRRSGPFTCSPWKISAIVVLIARKV